MYYRVTGLAVFLAGCGLAVLPGASPAVFRIGLPRSMMKDAEGPKFGVLEVNFRLVLKEQTGLTGDLVAVDSGPAVARQLANGEIQVGAFHGYEFAWQRPQHPGLEPIMVAAPDPNALKVVVLVAKANPAKGVAELRGQTLAAAPDLGPEARLFLDRLCLTAGVQRGDAFTKDHVSKSQEDALDDVIDGQAQAAAVSHAAVKLFQQRKPGRAVKLRVLAESAPFPPAVVAYQRDKLDAATVRKFRTGMETAHTTDRGSRLMSQIRINRFDPIPTDFARRLEETVKAYPPPA